jgi:hypothetical protein
MSRELFVYLVVRRDLCITGSKGQATIKPTVFTRIIGTLFFEKKSGWAVYSRQCCQRNPSCGVTMLRVYPRSNFVLPSTCAGHVRQTLSELMECGCEFVTVESLRWVIIPLRRVKNSKSFKRTRRKLGCWKKIRCRQKLHPWLTMKLIIVFLKMGCADYSSK